MHTAILDRAQALWSQLEMMDCHQLEKFIAKSMPNPLLEYRIDRDEESGFIEDTQPKAEMCSLYTTDLSDSSGERTEPLVGDSGSRLLRAFIILTGTRVASRK